MSINKEYAWLFVFFLLGVAGACGVGWLLGTLLQGLGTLVTR